MCWEGGVPPLGGDLALAALEGPPLPPERPRLRPGGLPLAGPAMSSASESLEFAEADLVERGLRERADL